MKRVPELWKTLFIVMAAMTVICTPAFGQAPYGYAPGYPAGSYCPPGSYEPPISFGPTMLPWQSMSQAPYDWHGGTWRSVPRQAPTPTDSTRSQGSQPSQPADSSTRSADSSSLPSANSNQSSTSNSFDNALSSNGSGTQDSSGSNFSSSGSISAPTSSTVASNSFSPSTVDHAFKFLLIETPFGTTAIQNTGRTKLAEDNNPIPRDRFIYNFDVFGRAQLVEGDNIDVVRHCIGVEKTFLGERASVSVRVPFANTLQTDLFTEFGSLPTDPVFGDTGNEFGDIHVTVKGLLLKSETLNIGTGLGVNLPTADDTRVFAESAFGDREVMRINNEAIVLTPFIGAVWTPDDRVFVQAWGAWDRDVRGNSIETTRDDPFALSLPLIHRGTLETPSMLQLDLQVGRWIYRSQRGLIQGLAPFAEIHYITTTDNDELTYDEFDFNNVLQTNTVRDAQGGTDELYLTAGFITQLSNRASLNVGAVAPLRDEGDRAMDWQVAVRFNWYFGATAARMNPASQLGGFTTGNW